MPFWRSYVNDIVLFWNWQHKAQMNNLFLLTTMKKPWMSIRRYVEWHSTTYRNVGYQHSCNHPVFQLQKKGNKTAHREHIMWRYIYLKKVVQCPHAILELYRKTTLKMCFLVKRLKMVEHVT